METQCIGNSSSTLSRDSPEMAIKEYSKGLNPQRQEEKETDQ